ncbi:MAG TPA: sialidase family protein [Mycobacteriales bacterium]|nr:sialidase family protein [Mycobacteriales bacterium]
MKQQRLRRVTALGSVAVLGAFAVAIAGSGTATAAEFTARPAGLPLPVATAATAGRQAATAPRAHTLVDPHIRRNVPNPLLKESLAGEDEDRDTPNPNLSALCQSQLGKPSPFGDPSPNVDVINGDPAISVGSQAGCAAMQNETTTAVNPFNPRNIVAGANDYRLVNTREGGNDANSFAYTSFDGGKTWTDVVIPGVSLPTGATTGPLSDMDSSGDPVVAFGPFNTVYFASLVFSRTNDGSGLAVNVSHDGGLHWGAPVIVRTDGVDADGNPLDTPVFNDKPWIAADPFSGRVYLTWTRFEFDEVTGAYIQSPIVISTSKDFGRTWSPEAPVGGTLDTFQTGFTPFAQGSNPKIALDGTLYVAYETSICQTAACDQVTDHDATVIARSRDHGKTFALTEVATNFDFPFDPDSGGGLTGENFRLNSFPQLTIDPLTSKLWVTWADDRNGAYDANGQSVKTNGDAIVASSFGGTHWTLKTVGTGSDEVFPAVAALAGRVAVSFITRGFDPNGIGLDYAYVVGTGHVSGARVRRITTQTQDPQVQFVSQDPDTGEIFQGVFIGDYSAMSVGLDFRIHPVWTDFRGRPGTNTPNQDIYTQSISLFR